MDTGLEWEAQCSVLELHGQRSAPLFHAVGKLPAWYQVGGGLLLLGLLVFYEPLCRSFPCVQGLHPVLRDPDGFGTMWLLPSRYREYMRDTAVAERLVAVVFLAAIALLIAAATKGLLWARHSLAKVRSLPPAALAAMLALDALEAQVVLLELLDRSLVTAPDKWRLHAAVLWGGGWWWLSTTLGPALVATVVAVGVNGASPSALPIRKTMWLFRLLRFMTLLEPAQRLTAQFFAVPPGPAPPPSPPIAAAQLAVGWACLSLSRPPAVPAAGGIPCKEADSNDAATAQHCCLKATLSTIQLVAWLSLPSATLGLGLVLVLLGAQSLTLLAFLLLGATAGCLGPASVAGFSTDVWLLLAAAVGSGVYPSSGAASALRATACCVLLLPALAYGWWFIGPRGARVFAVRPPVRSVLGSYASNAVPAALVVVSVAVGAAVQAAAGSSAVAAGALCLALGVTCEHLPALRNALAGLGDLRD